MRRRPIARQRSLAPSPARLAQHGLVPIWSPRGVLATRQQAEIIDEWNIVEPQGCQGSDRRFGMNEGLGGFRVRGEHNGHLPTCPC
jgi:hypothetical protein